MRILYGVCGDGMGHAMRSAVVGDHLVRQGHELAFVTSKGRAADFLERRFPGAVTHVVGLESVVGGNRLLPEATIAWNLARQALTPTLFHAVAAWRVGVPDRVVTDFEPWSARYGRLLGVPTVALDNVHFVSRCIHPRDVVASDRQAAAIGFAAIAGVVPHADRYLVTTIARPLSVQGDRTSLHAPIVRPEILSAKSSDEGHVLVYFNDHADHGAHLGALSELGDVRFVVYGMPGVTDGARLGNVTLRAMGDGFLGDLASCRAVIAGAGFTLVSEALALGKPILCRPFGGQFEQILNANYVTRLGYGMRCDTLDRATVRAFLQNVPAFRAALSGYRHEGNGELLSSLDHALVAGRP